MNFALFDVLMNIPHTLLFFYYNAKMVNVKNIKLYIFVAGILSGSIVYLNNIGVLDKDVRIIGTSVIFVFIGCFFTENRKQIIIFSAINYMLSMVLESVAFVLCYVFMGEHVAIVAQDKFYNVAFKLLFVLFYAVLISKTCRIWNKFNIKHIKSKNIDLILPVILIQITFYIVMCIEFMVNSKNIVTGAIALFSALAGILLDVIMYFLVNLIVDKENELYKEQIFDIRLSVQKKRELRLEQEVIKGNSIKADILSGIKVAENFLEERKLEKAFECLDEIINKVSPTYVNCKNKVVNAILEEKSYECENSGIKFVTDIELENNMAISNPELCIVVSNLLDNAIRACEKVVGKFISISAREKQGYLVIKQENSFDGVVENHHTGLLSEHGLGLGIIESLAMKYDGSLKTETEENPDGTHIFKTVVVLKNSN